MILITRLYDDTFPIELEYSGLFLLGEEEPSSLEEAKIRPSVEESNGRGDYFHSRQRNLGTH